MDCTYLASYEVNSGLNKKILQILTVEAVTVNDTNLGRLTFHLSRNIKNNNSFFQHFMKHPYFSV